MTYKSLIEFCNPIDVQGIEPETLGKLCLDSRKVEKGDIFIAVRGSQTDGHRFTGQAVESGASVIIVEDQIQPAAEEAVIRVRSTRDLLSPLAQKLAGDPAGRLTTIGITGTNGKTTVSTLIWQVLRQMNISTALLGTVSKKINDKEYPSRLTTADPVELAGDMKMMVEEGCEYLVMEVSSHALHQKRVHGIPFDVAAFTNLSLDHLDYHSNMEEYANAKKMLFDSLSSADWAVVNADDHYAGHMVSDTPAKVLDFSFKGRGLISAKTVKTSPEETVIEVEGVELKTPLVGKFNAYNTVQALLICTALGFDGKRIAEILAHCRGAEGRLEKVTPEAKTGREPVVFVDYAHTPDALENVASTLAELKTGHQKLLILFGCGGDRDKSKRPAMAKIAETYGDEVIVTSDNPRSEDPMEIIKDIEKGFTPGFSYRSIASRSEAIHTAITGGDEKTIVLIAGKGHETYQEVNGIRHHFDDREEVRKAFPDMNQNHTNGEVN